MAEMLAEEVKSRIEWQIRALKAERNDMEVQTRSDTGELRFFGSLKEAFAYADANPQVWKVSFSVETGERVRLVRDTSAEPWQYEPIGPE